MNKREQQRALALCQKIARLQLELATLLGYRPKSKPSKPVWTDETLGNGVIDPTTASKFEKLTGELVTPEREHKDLIYELSGKRIFQG